MHLPADQIIACLDGEADQSSCEHLANCLTCAACIEPYLGLQQDLWRALYRRQCPTSQTLSDFYLGLLPQTETAMIQLHLADCQLCLAELAELEQFLADV